MNKNEDDNLHSFKRTNLFVENIVDGLSFSIYHIAPILISIACSMCKGYIVVHFFFCVKLYYQVFFWDTVSISNLVLFYWMFQSVGNFLSQNYISSNWNINSNIVLGVIGLLAIILNLVLPQSIVYSTTLFIFALCLGFLENVCFVNLIDTLNHKHRRILYLLASLGYMLGCAISGAVIWSLRASGTSHPSGYLFGLLFLWLIVPVSSLFSIESPRILYYLYSSFDLAEYIINISYSDLNTYQQVCKSKEIITEIDYNKSIIKGKVRKSKSFLSGYKIAFSKKQRTQSAYSIFLVFIQTFMLFIIRGLEPGLLNLNNISINDSLFNKANFEIFTCYMAETVLVGLLILLFWFVKSKNIWFTLGLYIASLLIIILLLVFNTGFIYFLCILESIFYFNLMCIQLQNLEKTLTVSRNAVNSLMNISSNISFIFVFVLSNSLYSNYLYICLIGLIVLLLLSYFLEVYNNDPLYENRVMEEYENEILEIE